MRGHGTVVIIGSFVLVACGGHVASPFVTVPPATTTVPATTRSPATTDTEPATLPPTTVAAVAAPRPLRNPAGDGTLTLAFTGDALWHSPLWRQAERNYAATHAGGSGMDFTPMLAELRPVLESADLAVCHLETPIAPEGEQYSTHPLYGVPADVVPALADAGFDRCSTASNHALDRGAAGVERTVSVLEEHGLGQAGMARTPDEIEPRVFTVEGVVVSHLSYTETYNGNSVPEAWLSARVDPQRIIADAQRARRLGAEVVVVSMHWGEEGRAEVTADQRRVAEQLTASGAIDLIVGHHAHVLQPIEQINGVWVLFGLGNMISNMPTGPYPPSSQDGAIAVVDIQIADGAVYVSQPVIYPTWVDKNDGWIVRLVRPMLSDPATTAGLRSQLEVSLQRTEAVLAGYLDG